MKKLLKRAVKLFGRTAFAGVLCFIVWVSIQMFLLATKPVGGAVTEGAALAGNIVTLVFQTAIFVVVVYNDVWKWGNKDRNRVNFGRMAPRPWYGFKVGLIANVPAMVTFVVLVLDKLIGVWDFFIILYRFFHMGFYPLVVWGLGQNMQLYIADVPWDGLWIAGIPALLLPLIATLAYRLGYEDINVGERLMYQNKNKSETK